MFKNPKAQLPKLPAAQANCENVGPGIKMKTFVDVLRPPERGASLREKLARAIAVADFDAPTTIGCGSAVCSPLCRPWCVKIAPAPVVRCLRPHSPPPFRPAALPPLVAAIPCSPRASSTSTGVYIHDIEVRPLCSCVLTQGCSRSATCALCSPATLSPCSFFCLLLVRRRKVGRGPGLSAAPVHRLPGANQRGRAHRALFRLIFGEDLARAWPSFSFSSTRSLGWVGAQGAADVRDLRVPVVSGDAEAVRRLPVSVVGQIAASASLSRLPGSSGATGAHMRMWRL